ncbi:MAG: methionine--tRNA ligase [Calditrichia bacterium]
MDKKFKRVLITSALPYANGPLHLGHLAGAYLPGDIYARFCRLKKRDVVYICGSDEHGVPIMLRARKEGVSPQEVVDRYHEMNKKSFENFGMSFDYYGRTSSPVHRETSQEFFKTLAEKGLFVLKSETQLFDPEANIFLADRFVRGTCPHCGYEDAYGDQCEKCGTSLSPSDLKNPRSAVTNATPVKKETTHWYLPLADFQPKLEKWIAGHPDWRPNVLGQIKSWFTDGLKDRAVTRDLNWGVPVPEEVAREAGVDASGKVLYVWFDAPIGYISATKEWAVEKGKPELWKQYWQSEDTQLVHFIGKDNIVFHCLIFPAMLMGHGDYVLPDNVPANEFLNVKGLKFSTSRGIALWVDEFLQNYPADSLRYTLAVSMPETRDAEFSWEDFQARHNNELADILGNFINRTFIFVKNYFEGRLPAAGELDDLDRELLERLKAGREEVAEALDRFQFKEATRRFMEVARFANKYFNDQQPWVTRKSDLQKCATTLNLCVQTAYSLAIMMNPILPFTSQKIWNMLQLEGNADCAEWDRIGEQAIPDGHELGEIEILFQKIPDKVIAAEIEKWQKMGEEPAEKPEKAEPEEAQISFEEFMKVQLRTARVLEAEKVKKADKLLKLKIEVGNETRQIVAGVAQHYTPEEMVGKTIVIVANLKPAKIRGIESQGMLLAVKDGENLKLVTADGDVNSGCPVN